jgi:hypothetical protein
MKTGESPMKTWIGLSILAVLALVVSGCIVAFGGDPCKPRPACSHCPQPVVEREPIMAEIDAACSLISESDKFQLFTASASRPHLSDGAQIYLVRKTSKCFISESNKLDILLTLTNNPAFSPAGKAEILANLNMFISESVKRTILDEFNRLALKAAQTPPPVVEHAPAPTTP